MRTIAMRFSDNLAPKDGTIAEHKRIIEEKGFVWYGKFGAKVSEKTCAEIMSNESKRVLLIHSGTDKRYWLFLEEISYDLPKLLDIPEYYRDIAGSIKTWFKVLSIEKASKDVMSHCTVASSGNPLSNASKHSMSPVFIINYNEGA